MSKHHQRTRIGVLAAAALILGACGGGTIHTDIAPATRAPTTTTAADIAATSSQLGPWHLVGHEDEFGPAADEGVATVDGRVIYRGELDVIDGNLGPRWNHIGDPDGTGGGGILDAFQGPPGSTAKMFRLTTSTGAVREFVHPLAPGEEPYNSFVANTPDGRYTVTGEWQVERRLLVIPTPTMATPAGPVRLVGHISLDRPASDIQGCAFVTDTRLLCVSDDPGTTLWPTPFPLLEVDLPAPLDGHETSARVTDLGGLPVVSRCPGAFEPEGIDYDPSSGILRVEVDPPYPCSLSMTVYEYRA